MEPVFIPFAEWLPDLPDFKNPGASNVKNVIPDAIGYLPCPALSEVTTTAMNAKCRGAIAVKDEGLNVYNYAGVETKLYVQAAEVMTDVTSLAGAYATGALEFWEFIKWGNKLIATNFSDAPEVIILGASNFAALGGSPPKARHIGVVRDFVVMGNLDEAGTVNPQKIRWSGINDETAWAASATTQSDSQELFSSSPFGGGWVQKVVGGEYGTIFQEYTTWRMTYIGSPAIFQFDEIRPGIGTPSPNSVVRIGELIFFLGQDGFYVISHGSEVSPIGLNKIDRTFLADVNTERLDQVIGAADPSQRSIMWIYPSGASTTPNKAIIYNWIEKKWSPAEFNSEWLYPALGTGVTLDGLDSISTDIDAMTTSFDAREYVGGALMLAAFSTAHQKATFSGTALDATLETGDEQLIPGQRSHVCGVRPLIEGYGASMTVAVGTKNKVNEAVTYSAESSPHVDTNISPFRSNARYHRARVSLSGNFEHAVGIDAFAKHAGHR